MCIVVIFVDIGDVQLLSVYPDAHLCYTNVAAPKKKIICDTNVV